MFSELTWMFLTGACISANIRVKRVNEGAHTCDDESCIVLVGVMSDHLHAWPVWCLLASSWPHTPTHKCTHTHTSASWLLSSAGTNTSHTARALRGGSGGLWVGGQVFWQASPRSSPRTLGCLSRTLLLSTQGLLYQVSVTIALCLSLQIANRCPSRSRWVTHRRGERVGGIMRRVTGLHVKCCCKKHSSLLGLAGALKSTLTAFEERG